MGLWQPHGSPNLAQKTGLDNNQQKKKKKEKKKKKKENMQNCPGWPQNKTDRMRKEG